MFSVRYINSGGWHKANWYIFYDGKQLPFQMGFHTEWEALDFLAETHPNEAAELRRIYESVQ